jgi:hypothetical protein
MRQETPITDEDFLIIALDPAEWERLVTLDLLSPAELGTSPSSAPDNGPTHTIH